MYIVCISESFFFLVCIFKNSIKTFEVNVDLQKEGHKVYI